MKLKMAPLDHRAHVYSYSRAQGRWPTRAEWRFIIIGRWKGF